MYYCYYYYCNSCLLYYYYYFSKQAPLTKHFALKRKPKAAALRAELINRSSDAQANIKKSLLPTVPVRSRGMPRKMNDTSGYWWLLTASLCVCVCVSGEVIVIVQYILCLFLCLCVKLFVFLFLSYSPPQGYTQPSTGFGTARIRSGVYSCEQTAGKTVNCEKRRRNQATRNHRVTHCSTTGERC